MVHPNNALCNYLKCHLSKIFNKLRKHLPHNVKVRKGKVANHINYNFVSTHKKTDKAVKFGTLKAY